MARQARAPWRFALVATLVAASAAFGTNEPDDFRAVIASHAKSRAEVVLRFRYDPDLLCEMARVHGPMVKEATERPAHQLSDASVDAYKGSLVPMRQLNVMWISDKHHFIYLRSHKSASTSITSALWALFCKGNGACSKSTLRIHRGQFGDPDKWRDYFVFTFVRNPWTRMGSAYTYFNSILRGVSPETGHVSASKRCDAGSSFLRFTVNTESYVEACKQEHCFAWDHQKAMPMHMLDTHFNEQSHAIFTADGKCMVDFIGRVENFDEDWAELWEVISKKRGQPFQRPRPRELNSFKGERPKQSRYKNTCGADEFEALYNETTMFNIAMQYARDIVTLGLLA